MPLFEYRVQEANGRMVTGTMEAPSQRDLFQTLQRDGRMPIRIAQTSSVAGDRTGFQWPWAGRVRAKHLVPFTRQLATLVKAGIPILSALDALWQQTEDEPLKDVIQGLSRDIQGGMTLSRAMARHPRAFEGFIVNSVAAGEAGGALGEVFEDLADFLEHQAKVKSDVRGALLFPAATAVILLAAIMCLSLFVVPRFATMFSRFKTELPMPTQVLMAFSGFMVDYWWLVLLSGAAGIWALVYYGRTSRGRAVLDRLKLRAPVFGSMFLWMAMHRFARIMAMLTRTGVPVLQSLEVAGRTIGNETVAHEVRGMQENIARGNSLAGAMSEGAHFTPLARHMVAIGEKTGQVQSMFESIAQHYDRELKAMIRNMTTLIQPILTVVLAGFALFLALAIFLPMWDMIKLFKGGGGG